jgi:undecaprenyl-diphosphatase
MQRFAGFLQATVAGMGSVWGGFGLFFIAFCDSSFLSLPEINDLLIIYFCTRFKEYAYFYALMATLGSTAGCVVLYWLGRWKGYGYLRRKYSESKLESVLGIFQRYGVFALIIPALWPPPLPFKIFVLSAGIFGFSFPRFLGAILLGRSTRYFFEAVMAVRYGDQALAYLRENYMTFVYVVFALVVVGFVTYLAVTQLRRRQLQLR